MRLVDRDDLVVEAHRRLEDARRPVFRDSENERIALPGTLGPDRGFFEGGAIRDDAALIRR